jgi:hypothetical protein
MYTLQDIADIYCCSTRTIFRKIQNILPILRQFKQNSRKRTYTKTDLQIIINHIGTPPKNKYNSHLTDNLDNTQAY